MILPQTNREAEKMMNLILDGLMLNNYISSTIIIHRSKDL